MRTNSKSPLARRTSPDSVLGRRSYLRLNELDSRTPAGIAIVKDPHDIEAISAFESYDRDLNRTNRGLRPAVRRRIVIFTIFFSVALVLLGTKLGYSATNLTYSGSNSSNLEPIFPKLGQNQKYPWVIPPSSSRPEVVSGDEVDYCNAGFLENDMNFEAEGLELKQVQIAIRHGDRSAIHSIPGADSAFWDCNTFSPEIEHIWKEVVNRVRVLDTEGNVLERSLWSSIIEPLSSNKGKSEPNRGKCEPGQLTDIGIRQHLSLGEKFRGLYRSIVNELEPNRGLLGGLYVRSTDYTRTIQSAAAFMTGLLGMEDDTLEIYINSDEDKEAMHGIGLKSSSNVVGGGERPIEGKCKKAVQYAINQAASIELNVRADVKLRMLETFGAAAAESKITHVMDSVYARLCHNKPLPCTAEKGGKCIGKKFTHGLIAESHKRYCMEFLGGQGGLIATQLSMYPFMLELLENMEKMDLFQLSENVKNVPYKLAIYSGHDTVIAPILAILGIYDCQWPPYASHIQLELWKSKECSLENSLKTTSYRPNNSELGCGKSYVRVIYNGNILTKNVRGCFLASSEHRFSPDFCPLAIFSGLIRGLIKPYLTLDEACKS